MSLAKTIAYLLASAGSILGGGAGIWWVTKSINDASILEQQESREGMKEYRTLNTDQDFNNSTYKDKYGGVYGKYLVGVHKTAKDPSKNSQSNDSWWEWAYEKYKLANTAKGKFSKITKATGEEDSALKQVCKKAYEQVKVNDGESFSNIVPTNDSVAPNQFSETDIWRFCSIIGVKPKTLAEAQYDTYPNDSNGGINSDKKVFISIDARENTNFWNYQEKTLKSQIDESKDKFFSSKKSKQIKEICRDAYNVKLSENGGVEGATINLEIDKYCKMTNAIMQMENNA